MITSVLVWIDIIEIAGKACKNFDISYSKILPETHKLVERYGQCTPCDRCFNSKSINEDHCKEKIIQIRLHQLGKPRKPLSTKTILRTLAHELAHLKYWCHGREHAQFTHEVTKYIKSLGYVI